MSRVIFSIDNYHDPHVLAKFLRHMDTQKALGKLCGKFGVLHGSWRGIPELAFECNIKDYANFVIPFGVTKNQEVVLVIHSNGEVVGLSYNKTTRLGTWTEVPELEAKMSEGYTYRPEDKKWFLIK